MPGEDGYSLILSIRNQEKGVSRRLPAIALTAHTRPEDVEHALASGFQIHLAKPVDSRRLWIPSPRSSNRTHQARLTPRRPCYHPPFGALRLSEGRALCLSPHRHAARF